MSKRERERESDDAMRCQSSGTRFHGDDRTWKFFCFSDSKSERRRDAQLKI